jgi:hypothetical protein
MLYRLLADLTVLAHALFVLFVVCGGLAVLRRPRLAWLHLPAATWGAVVEFKGWICPLTYVENHFRRLGGEGSYDVSFIEYYLEPILYPSWPTPRSQLIMGLVVVGVNAVIYALLLRKRPCRQ